MSARGHAGSKPQVDVNLPRLNQAMTAVLTAIAFVIQWWPLVAITWLVVVVTRFSRHRLGPWSQLYLRAIRPRLTSPVETEWAAPPRFSQTLAVIFLGVATALLAVGLSLAGWIVTLVITALATLASAARLCVGCIVYEGVVTR